jgi:hypothetical protein
MEKKRTAIIAAILFFGFLSALWGSDVTIPNTFTGGMPAYATEVNDNFSAVAAAVNDNDARLDILDAQSTVRSVEGVSNDNGNIDLVPGGTVSISGNDAANQITISASADGGNANLLDGIDSTGFASASHTHPLSITQARFSFIVFNISNGAYVASGAIDTNGAVMNGSANVSAVWNAGSNRYEITISGYSYFWTSYHTSITPYDQVRSWEVGSMGGDLIVQFYN